MNSINENSPEALRSEILRLTRLYSNLSHKSFLPDDERKEYKKTKNTVPYAGRVFGCEEVEAAVDSALEFWLTLGKKGFSLKTFRKDLV